MKTTTKFWMGIGVLILLSPLGLWLPAYFKSGTAWGEWKTTTIRELTGYVPQGLAKFSRLWSAPFADYTFRGVEKKGLVGLGLDYIISSIVGIALVVLLILLVARCLVKKGD